jgi:RNA polymerase sigma-70 factor, ECF subfamily
VDPQHSEEFREYVAARSSALLRTAYLLTANRSDAEDLLQTALAKAYLAWPRVRSVDNPDAYVRRIMANQRTSWWRRTRHVDEVGFEKAPEVGGRDEFADVDLHDALWQALATLPRRMRAVLVLRYYEQLSEAEIAAALGISEGTVKSQASRALARLRESAGLVEDPRAALPVPQTTTTQGARP